MLTVAEETLQQLAAERGKRVATHLYGQEINAETYAICKADLVLKGGRRRPQHRGRPERAALSQRCIPGAQDRPHAVLRVLRSQLHLQWQDHGACRPHPGAVKAIRQGDELQVCKAVEALAADERAKTHTIPADRLRAPLQSGNGRHARRTPLLAIEREVSGH